MRIALINEFFPPFAPGGAEWSMYELAHALTEKKHQISVITPNYGAKSFEINSGIHVHRYSFIKKMTSERRLPGFIWHANLLFYFYSAVQIFIIAKKENVELLHVQNKYSLPGSWIASRLLGIPIICTIRDTSHICRIAVCLNHRDTVPKDCGLTKLLAECSEEYFNLYYEKKTNWNHTKDKLWQIYHWVDVHLRRWFLNRVDEVVGVSDGIMNVYKKAGIFSKAGLTRKVLYNFIQIKNNKSSTADLRKKYNLQNKQIVLYVGGITIGKGAFDFGEAARILKTGGENPNLEFIMIGSGQFAHEKFPVQIFNSLTHEETSEFYQIAETVVVPSIRPEPLSRVILEAMAAGKPVVGTRVGGTPEVILHGENGFVVERENPKLLAEAILRIVSNESLRERMGERSLELIREKFSREVMIQEFEKQYQECIQK